MDTGKLHAPTKATSETLNNHLSYSHLLENDPDSVSIAKSSPKSLDFRSRNPTLVFVKKIKSQSSSPVQPVISYTHS